MMEASHPVQAILVLLVCLLSVLSFTLAHECVHGGGEVTHVLEKRAEAYSKGGFFTDDGELEGSLHPEERRLHQTVSDRPYEIHLEYQLDGLEDQYKSLIQNVLIPETVSEIRGFLSAKVPVDGKLLLSRQCNSFWNTNPPLCYDVYPVSECLVATHNTSYFGAYKTCPEANEDSCTTYAAGAGVEDVDLILYVTASQTTSCGSATVAYAGFCELDQITQRPIAGNINFCPGMLEEKFDLVGELLDVSVHEVFHILAFSTSLYSYFLDENGNARGLENTVRDSGTKKSIITPAVVEHAADHFGCGAVTEVHLENEGGDSTAFSHWEQLYMSGDIMMGVSANKRRAVLSNITLALLQDSGWYNVDFSKAGFLHHGHDEGCNFVQDTHSCSERVDLFPDYYCPADDSTIRCSQDFIGFEYCSDLNTAGGCLIQRMYSNGLCTESGLHDESREKFGETYGPNSRCFAVASDTIQVSDGQYVYSTTIAGSHCFKAFCDKEGANDVLYVGIGASYKICPEGEYVSYADIDSSFRSGRIGPCPSATEVCSHFGCPNDCSSNGYCHDGTCYCHLGYAGNDCATGLGTSAPSTPAESPSVPAPTSPQTSDESPSTAPSTPAPSPTPSSEPSVQTSVHTYRCFDGYLAGCNAFVDVDGNQRMDVSTEIYNVTDGQGLASLTHSYTTESVYVVVTDESASNCKDVFTGLAIPFPFVSLVDSTIISPLTTLGVALIKRYGLPKESASSKVNQMSLGESSNSDVFTHDAIVSAASPTGDENALILSSMLTSTVALVSSYALGDPSLGIEKHDVCSHVIEAMADIVFNSQAAFSFTSDDDIKAVVSQMNSNVPTYALDVTSEAGGLFVQVVTTVNSLHANLSHDVALVEEVAKIAKFSQVNASVQLSDLALASASGSNLASIMQDTQTFISSSISLDAINSTAFDPITDVSAYLADDASGEGGNEGEAIDSILVSDDIVTDITDFVEDNVLYIAIGGGVLMVLLLVVVSRSLSRSAQNVKPEASDEYFSQQ